jgi:sigma-B regulation protein RsbU (phosphoserine phosphatase)
VTTLPNDVERGLLDHHATRLDRLAEAWLASGARSFEVYLGGACLVRRGAPEPRSGRLAVPIALPGSEPLELRVTGVGDERARHQLAMEAELIAEASALDDELQRMTGELIDAQDQLLAMYGLAQVTRRRLSLDAVLTELVGELQRLTGAELAFAALGQPPDVRLVCFPSVAEEYRPVFQRAFDWTTGSQRPLIVSPSQRAPAEIDPPDAIRNFVAVPVEVEEQPRAALGIVNQRDTTFSAATVKLLRAVAEHAGGLIESAVLHEHALRRERLQRDMELAASIQAGLMMGQPPSVSGLDLVGRFRPAAEVGGDFYDYRLRADGQLAFSVGDVSGKGLSAALVMEMTRTVLRGAFQVLDRPSAVLELANSDLYEDLSRVNTFVTAFAGYYDAASRLVRFASAGHSPVVYCPHGEAPRLLAARSLPLGVLPDSPADDDVVRLGPGDLLVVGTDGFSEATDQSGGLFGNERLLSLVQTLSSAPATAIAEGLFAALTTFGDGRPQDDDQTLVVAKGC